MFVRFKGTCLLIGSLALSSFTAWGESVTLAWDPSPSPTTVGYRLHWGTVSLYYTSSLNTGSATSATVSNLVQGLTYYFAVTAYDAYGLESPYSDEVSYTVPLDSLLATMQLSLVGSTQPRLIGTAPAGYQYDVLVANLDLATWSKIGSITVDSSGAFQFTDPNPATDSSRFYRLLQTFP